MFVSQNVLLVLWELNRYLFVVSVQSRMQLFGVSAPSTSHYLMTWLAPTLALVLVQWYCTALRNRCGAIADIPSPYANTMYVDGRCLCIMQPFSTGDTILSFWEN